MSIYPKLANNAASTLAAGISSAATSLSVAVGDGSKFPSLGAGDWFPLTLVNASGGYEIVKCTARSGDVFTITRAQETTSALSFSAGDRVGLRLTAGAIAAMSVAVNNLSDVTSAATARTNLGLGDASTHAATDFATAAQGAKADEAILYDSGKYPAADGSQITNVFTGSLGGFRNHLMNGGMAVDQRNSGSTQTFTAGAALAYSVDRWYTYCTGGNISGQRVGGSGNTQFRYQFVGGPGCTAIGFGQRISAENSVDLAGTTAVLSVDLANTLLTTVTWTAYYANTANAFGTLSAPARTQIATGTFTVTNSVARYQTNISIPSAAITGIEIVFSVGAQTSGTWTIGNAQFEAGPAATAFEHRTHEVELAMCQSYFEKNGALITGGQASGGGGSQSYWFFKSTKRVTPTMNYGGGSAGSSYQLTKDFASLQNINDYAIIDTGSTASAEL